MTTAPIQITAENWAAGQIMPGFKHPPIWAFLGADLISHDAATGILRLSFPTKPDYANPSGAVMGGIITSFLDDSMGPLVVAATGGTKFPVSTDLHTQFFKPVPIGPRCVVESRIERIGRNIAFTSAVAFNPRGEICAKAVHTAMLMDAPSL